MRCWGCWNSSTGAAATFSIYASRYLEGALGSDRYRAPDVISRNMQEGRIGLRTGAGFLDYSGLDVDAYREQRLAQLVDMLRHFGLARPPVIEIAITPNTSCSTPSRITATPSSSIVVPIIGRSKWPAV